MVEPQKQPQKPRLSQRKPPSFSEAQTRQYHPSFFLQNQAGKEEAIPLQGLYSDLLVDLWDRILPFAEFSLLL